MEFIKRVGTIFGEYDKMQGLSSTLSFLHNEFK